MERSMFERFQKAGCPVTMLSVQYRMHPFIRQFPSQHFYNNQLIDGWVTLTSTTPHVPMLGVSSLYVVLFAWVWLATCRLNLDFASGCPCYHGLYYHSMCYETGDLAFRHDMVLLCCLLQSLEKTFATGMTPAATYQCSALIDVLVTVQGHVMTMTHSIHDSAASQEGQTW